MIALFCMTLVGLASTPGQSSVVIEADSFELTIHQDEFSDRFPTDDLEAITPLLTALTVDGTWLSVDGERCLVAKGAVERVEGERSVRLTARILCEQGTRWRYFPTWIRGRDPAHQHTVVAFGKPVGTFGVDQTDIDLADSPPPSLIAPATMAAGVGVLGLLLGLLAIALASVALWRRSAT